MTMPMAVPMATMVPKGPTCPSCKRAQPMTPESPSLPINVHNGQIPVSPLPITPPEIDIDSESLDAASIVTAIHVLSTERAALQHLEALYQTDYEAQARFAAATTQIKRTIVAGGKIVFTGVGKSGKIGQKLVATMNSLGVTSVWLDPTDALHGDLGLVRPNDTWFLITFSGKTQELLSLVPYIPPTCSVILMTSHITASTCVLIQHVPRTILLSAPIHEAEATSFGLSAPTSSTTVSLALGDALALAVGQSLHNTAERTPADVFREFHPGGAIGAAAAGTSRIISNANNPTAADPEVIRMSDVAVSLADIPVTTSSSPLDQLLRPVDIVLAVVRAPSARGWARISASHLIAPRRIRAFQDTSMTSADAKLDADVVIEKQNWISVLGSSSVDEVRDWILNLRNEGDCRGRVFLKSGTILGIVDARGEIGGVVEIEDIVSPQDLMS